MRVSRYYTLGGLVVVLATAALSAWAYPRLPAELASHWNAAGEVDGTMAKGVYLAFAPLLAAGVWGLFALLPRIDPRRENYDQFGPAYEAFALLTLGFLAALHAAVVAVNLGHDVAVTQVVAAAAGVLVLGAAGLLARVEPNWFAGVRTPWTLEDDRVWRATHRHAALGFALTGLATLATLLAPDYTVSVLLGGTLGTAAYAVGYSYWAYRRRHPQ